MLSEEKRNFGNIAPEYTVRPFVQDQAEGLRQLVKSTGKLARTIAITSGKGGVGKTNVAVNLSLALAQAGHKTLLVDVDLGLANADILLNIVPRYNLSHVISGKKEIGEITMNINSHLDVIAGASGVDRLANLRDEERSRLISGFTGLQHTYQYILFDTGAGISGNTMSFLTASDAVILVTVPEPPAIVDAYAVIKMLTMREAVGDLYLVVNRVRDKAEADRVANGLTSVANKFLNAYVETLGFLVEDAAVGTAVRNKRPFYSATPHAAVSQGLRQIRDRICRQRTASQDEGDHPGFIRRFLNALVGTP